MKVRDFVLAKFPDLAKLEDEVVREKLIETFCGLQYFNPSLPEDVELEPRKSLKQLMNESITGKRYNSKEAN